MPRKALAEPAGEPRLHDQSRRYSQRPTQEHRVSEHLRAADALHRACARGIERGGRAAAAYFGAPSPVWQGHENAYRGVAGERVPAGNHGAEASTPRRPLPRYPTLLID